LIGDSSLLEYAARGRCDVQVLRGHQTNRYLSLASPVGSAYRDRLSLTVLELLERGEMARLTENWFCAASTSHRAVDCDHSANSTAAEHNLLQPSRYLRHSLPFTRTRAARSCAAPVLTSPTNYFFNSTCRLVFKMRSSVLSDCFYFILFSLFFS